MLLRRRTRTSEQNGELAGAPQLREQIDALTAAELEQVSAEREQRLIELRHLLGIRLLAERSEEARFPTPLDAGLRAANGELPELAPGDLDPSGLRAGILRGGCVLVRGLIGRAEAIALADGIERAFAEREHRIADRPHDSLYYHEFAPRPPFKALDERAWTKLGGGLLGADSPRLTFEMMRLFGQAGLPELVRGYLGEPALISGQKTTMRRAEPSVKGAWHQDGYFLGPVRSLNLWLSLSRCGDEAPGLDIVPRRLDRLLPAGTDEASFTVAECDVVALGAPVLRPIFEPGDALFFDELFLHQTAADPAMPNPRFAIENWFFGPSGFPADYAPIAV